VTAVAMDATSVLSLSFKSSVRRQSDRDRHLRAGRVTVGPTVAPNNRQASNCKVKDR
jgi:hypothetical protein